MDTEAKVSPELVALLRCPVTGQRLNDAPAELLRRVKAERLTDQRGESLAESVAAALVTADGTRLYPIRSGIPVMLVEESFILVPSGISL